MTQKTQVTEPDVEFEWPKFKSDAERIKFNTAAYANCSFEEAFSQAYGVKIKDFGEIAQLSINELPQTVKVGDVITVKILAVNKDNVTVDAGNIKENISCKNNLYKYEKFRNPFKPFEVAAEVVKKDNKQTIIDIIQPMYNAWVTKITLNPSFQCNVEKNMSVLVYNLQLTRGGYTGKVQVPEIEDFVGDNYTVDAFIPGSQIVLNIETDFERWNGKTVAAFITNFAPHPTKPGKIMAICSVKKYMEHLGNCNMIDMFKEYTEQTEWWKNFAKMPLTGIVTGIINSSKNCGVFVEIPEYRITGMISMKPQDIVKFSPQQQIKVKITGFEVPTYYNSDVDQTQHAIPYEYDEKDKNILKYCGLKPVLTLFK